MEYVKNWIKKQLNKQRKGYKLYNSYKPPFPRFEHQTDIMDMSYLKQNNQPRYALVVIPGHALHEKGLQRQKSIVPLVGSQDQRALLVPVINR